MRKKKGFQIDKITEDSFYENILLGLPQFLRKCPFVSGLQFNPLPPATLDQVLAWEQHNMPLPADLRSFYLSTDGLLLAYRFKYEGYEADDVSIAGRIEVRPLALLTRVDNARLTCCTDAGPKFLHPASRVYALVDVDERHCVVMAQFKPHAPPNYWLYARGRDFYFLSNDFTTYLRMEITHLGVVGWQLSAIDGSYTEWVSECFQLMAPGLLQTNYNTAQRGDRNVINPEIFNWEAAGGEQEAGTRTRSASETKSGKKRPIKARKVK